MNSFSADIESELIDLDAVPFTKLRELDSEPLRRSLVQVVERTRCVNARYRSQDDGSGERID
jgi:hypothetical protein